MGTSVYATYKCNMCNKPLQHVEQPREACVACTLQQHMKQLKYGLETSTTIIVISMFQYL
jgi:DNA-directed RNA polymerase subunit RPC12/RpoP